MAKVKPNLPATPPEMSDKDKIARAIILGLTEQEFSVALLMNGEIGVHMTDSDFTIKITKKKERVI